MDIFSWVATAKETLRHWFSEGIFRRIFKNAGFLLSGRVATGLIGLGTLTLSARSLGVEQFGVLVLLQTYAQVVGTMATFHSPQATVRYGAQALQRDDKQAFQSLLKFITLLDIGGGIIAVAVGFIAGPLVGPHMGWSPEIVHYAQLYTIMVFFTSSALPLGILRLLDRFDLIAAQVTVTPFLRLAGIAIAAMLHAPFWGYLLACFVAQMAGGIVLQCLAWREVYRRKMLEGFTFSVRGLSADHPGLMRFIVFSNIYSSLLILCGHASTFLCGYLAGPAAAGIYKIGMNFSTILTKPAELLNQSIYPEFARLDSAGRWKEFGQLMRRGATIALGVSTVVISVVVFLGEPFLMLSFGDKFTAAYVPLVLLTAAAGLEVIGFPLDAALLALGRAELPLRVSTAIIFLIQLPLMVVFTRNFGPAGAGFAVLAAAATTLTVMSFVAYNELHKRTNPGTPFPLFARLSSRIGGLGFGPNKLRTSP